jgi:hypothetical protein
MKAWLIGVALMLAGASALHASELDLAYDEMVAAHAQLERALAARERGAEPLPGERSGTAGGQSRLGDAYWERQKRLDAEVERARKRLDEAIARWNAVR